MKNDNAISFNLILKWSLSLDVIDKSKLLQYNSSNSVMNLEWSICFGGIAKWSPLERRSLSLDANLEDEKFFKKTFLDHEGRLLQDPK